MLKGPWTYLIQATRNGHAQARRAPTRLHSTLSDSRPGLHTSMYLHKTLYKKPKLTHAASTGRLMSWLQGASKTKITGKLQHDTDEADMQHNTSGTASCKLAPLGHSRHAHMPGSIQACFADATLNRTAAKQQPAPGYTVITKSPTVLQKPPAKDSIALDTKMHLQQQEVASDCSISLDTTRRARKVRQASTLSETCRAETTSRTEEQSATTKEKKVAGAYTPCCDTVPVLTWNVMGSTMCQMSSLINRGSHALLC